MEIFISLVLGGIILYCLHYLWYRNVEYWKNRNFPYFDQGPFASFRDVIKILFPKQSMEGTIIENYKKTKEFKYYAFTTLFKDQLIVRDPEAIYNVLIKDFSYFVDRPFPLDEESDPLSGHLFGLKGDRWRALRYKLAPTFTSGKLKAMVPQIASCADDILAFVGGKGLGYAVDSKEMLNCFTLNVIGSVAFGMKVDSHESIDSGEKNEFLEYAQRFFKPSKGRLMKFVLLNLFPKLAKLLGVSFAEKDVQEFFVKLIRDAVKLRRESGIKRNDFLQLMMNIQSRDEESEDKSSGEQTCEVRDEPQDALDKELLGNLQKTNTQFKITENTLAANSFVFIGAGSETMANALNFTFYELAVNPDVQKKAHEEIDRHLSQKEFDHQALGAMTYVDNIIHESLRKHPPMGSLMRICTRDYTFPGTSHVIKEGDHLFVPTVALHCDPELFPDPEKFDPDRFLDATNIPKGAYLPFGIGPRFCIAIRFVHLVLKIFIVKTLAEYSVKLSPKTKLPITLAVKNSFTKQIEGGLWLEFEPRKSSS